MAKTSGNIRATSIGDVDNAIEEYVSGEMMWLNNYLRGISEVDSLSSSEQRTLNLLTQATNKPLGEQTTLYRSVDASAIFGQMSDLSYYNLYNRLLYGRETGKGAYIERINTDIDRLLSNAKGKVIIERGFMSTTRKKSVATEWGDFSGSSKPIVLKIKTSKSTRGRDVSKLDKNTDSPQKEVLLGRNQKYKVGRIYGSNGNIFVDVEIL